MSEESATKEDFRIGDQMPDGTIYAGISPDTGKPMYATPADAPLTYTFNQAIEYAAKLKLEESNPKSKTWRVPSKNELNVLWENRNKGKLAGTFNETGSKTAGDLALWYQSSAPAGDDIRYVQRFTDGYQSFFYRNIGSSLRCVR